MVQNRTKQEIIDSIKWKLNNALKGQAFSLTTFWTDAMITPEEKMKEMEVIGEFKKYIDDYEANLAIIERCKEYEARFVDDGR